jgi:predicted lipoprotein with Yx(FWY)xxD motif
VIGKTLLEEKSLEARGPVVQSMRRSIILSTLVIGAAALGVAACGGSGDDSGASPAGSSTGIVSVANVDGTNVLADSAGKTLYSAAVEKGGKIHCVDACLSFWDPMLASSADAKKTAGELDAKLGVVTRPDGKRQLTFEGLPLYTFAEEGAGKLEGDGFVDDFQGTHFEWEAARTSGGSQPSGSSAPSDNMPGSGYGY